MESCQFSALELSKEEKRRGDSGGVKERVCLLNRLNVTISLRGVGDGVAAEIYLMLSFKNHLIYTNHMPRNKSTVEF